MGLRVNWLSILIRVAGSATPLTAPLVQLQSELDSRVLERRVDRIEDPISTLHPDIRSLATQLYVALCDRRSSHVDLTDEQYSAAARPLALLEGAGYIRGAHGIGQRWVGGLTMSPTFVLYLAALEESSVAMKAVLERVDTAPPGRWLDGDALAREFSVPVPAVRAVLELFAARGLGILSQEVGKTAYYARA